MKKVILLLSALNMSANHNSKEMFNLKVSCKLCYPRCFTVNNILWLDESRAAATLWNRNKKMIVKTELTFELNISFEMCIMTDPFLIIFFPVSLDSADYGMIAVFAIFGTLIAIGTIADSILNIIKLEIIPEKFLQVQFQRIFHLLMFSLVFSRIFCLQ